LDPHRLAFDTNEDPHSLPHSNFELRIACSGGADDRRHARPSKNKNPEPTTKANLVQISSPTNIQHRWYRHDSIHISHWKDPFIRQKYLGVEEYKAAVALFSKNNFIIDRIEHS
jgi:hypothetical protein